MGDTTNHSEPRFGPKPILGLMGAPGSGKSTIARYFAELGCGVIDADRLAHGAIQTPQAKDKLRAWWGGHVFDELGEVNRTAVGQIVFNDRDELRRLEELIHPIVHQGRATQRQALMAGPAVVAIVEDCPLLLESKLDQQCDATVFIDCPGSVRYERLLQSRGWDRAEVQKREESQLPLDIKRQSADYVILNDGPVEGIRSQVEQVLRAARR